MKKILFFCWLAIILNACTINKQAQQIKALEQCEYKLVDAANITLAGTDVSQLVNGQSIDLSNLPALAFGYLRQDIPLKASFSLQITNPSKKMAAINNFDYKILVNQQELINGSLNQRISIAPGQSTKVPLQLNANIYQFLANPKILKEITEFLSAPAKGVEKKGLLTLKIKPSILVGSKLVKLPSFITIDREISSKILF